jgi:hypothetical protein
MSRKSTLLYMVVAVVLTATIAGLAGSYVGLKVGPIYEKNKECCGLNRPRNLFLALKEFAGFVEFHCHGR